jgi:hypothetical protein
VADFRLAAMARVTLAEALRAAGDRAAARELLAAADRWYTASGGGDGAALAACLLATVRAEDGEPGAESELTAIHAAARRAGDRRVEALARDALAAALASRG